MISKTYIKRPQLRVVPARSLKSSPTALANSRKHYQDNKDEHSRQAQTWREQNPGEVARLAKEWRENNPGYNSNYMKQKREGLLGPFTEADGPDWQQRNREDHLKRKRASTNSTRRKVVLEAFKVYGGESPACYCCGEDITMLLGLDHIHGGGTKQRREEKMSHTSAWAKRNGWPPIFRVACHSCNLGAHLNGGVCPHQEKK